MSQRSASTYSCMTEAVRAGDANHFSTSDEEGAARMPLQRRYALGKAHNIQRALE
ncbi:MAG: hypothetical protein NVSMB53_17080 [Gemmatimonadaceae bacterium]